jgi:hypothetical protein
MNKLDNYIYLTICEVAMKEMKKTNYVSFVSYCNGMSYSLRQDYLYPREKGAIVNITNILDKVYSLDELETANHIVDFFNMEPDKILVFQRCVMETLEFYPMSCD